MSMHPKQLGNIGELKVATDLASKGYYVFTELGDICKSDLIVMDETYVPIKVQVKCYKTTNGSVAIKSSKSGPNYRFKYQQEHADVYAVYLRDKDLILYISADELLSMNTLTIRTDLAKNNQITNINWHEDYSDFKRALRGHTCDTQTDLAVGEEMVQTSKPSGGLGN